MSSFIVGDKIVVKDGGGRLSGYEAGHTGVVVLVDNDPRYIKVHFDHQSRPKGTLYVFADEIMLQRNPLLDLEAMAADYVALTNLPRPE